MYIYIHNIKSLAIVHNHEASLTIINHCCCCCCCCCCGGGGGGGGVGVGVGVGVVVVLLVPSRE